MRGKMKNIFRACLTVSSFLAIGYGISGLAASPVAAQASDITGKYCSSFMREQRLPVGPGGLCPQGSVPVGENECIHGVEIPKVIALRHFGDNQLQFGLSLWFANGHHCGLTGTAQPVGENRWRYERDINAENMDERCAVNFAREGDIIRLDADTDAACRSYCGAQAGIHNIQFDQSIKEQDFVVPEFFDMETLFEVTCGL